MAIRSVEIAADLVPPDLRAAAAVGVDQHLARATAGAADVGLFGLPGFDPQRDLAGVVALPQVGLVVRAQATPEAQALVRIHREGQQAHHQPLLGFRGMQGQREVVFLVVVPVQIGDLQLDFVDSGFWGHPCSVARPAPAFSDVAGR